MNSMLLDFLAGANSLGFILIALYFLKFWRRTRDPFFGGFAIAFFIMGVGRVVEAISRNTHASTPAVYIFRLLAFAIIIFAIAQKNLKAKK
jgi:hypothetical protein